MIRKIRLCTALLFALGCVAAPRAQQIERPSIGGSSSFAVIADSLTYVNCRPQIELYKKTIESEGLPVFVAYAQWQSPEQVRTLLKRLHDEESLEGCVFIGDIPIAMITRAQHLTSAFKMDERKYPLRECSVPSDRFYDDFDLVFTKRDEPADGLMHFYAMAPDSPQYISCDIYSARIKPQTSYGDPYAQIARYLEKVVREHKSGNEFDNFVSYTGHGSYSNSLTAWRSEQQISGEQFGGRFAAGNRARYLRYSMEPYMKYELIRELRRKDLDFMVFHEHGDYFRQYVSGEPVTTDTEGHIEQMEMRLRALYRRSPELAAKYADRWGLDSTWYADANTPAAIEKDSILDLRLGIINEEIGDIRPNARMVIFDACFNGDFRNDDYIAGKYIFSEGDCCVAWANSVNVLQDKSAFDLLGLLGHGARIGVWAKHINILESHISGDPTFFFASPDAKSLDINRNVLRKDAAYWLGQLDSDIPDMRCLALIRLYEEDYPQISDLLLAQFTASPYAVVRHTAFRLAESLNDANFREILAASVTDSFEFIRRIGVTRMGRVGDDRFIPLLIDTYITDNNSARVVFQTLQSLKGFDRDKVLEAIDRRFDGADFYNAERYRKGLTAAIETRTAENGQPQDLFEIADRNDTKWRKFYISYLKNCPKSQYARQFADILCDETEDEQLRITMAEALAWFNLSANRQVIIDACERLLDKGGMSEELTREVTRARTRLTSKK